MNKNRDQSHYLNNVEKNLIAYIETWTPASLNIKF